MNEVEQAVADRLYAAIQDESNLSVRSLQSREFRAGVSDLGFCSERTKRMIDQQVPEDRDVLTAWIGTQLGDGLERAAKRAWEDAIIQSEVEVRLTGETREYVLTGHPDIVLPSDGMLLDGKSTYGLSTVERSGPSQSQQFQRHCYAKGAWEAGMFGDLPLEEVQVGNVWIDRGGIDKRLHVQTEPFDPEQVAEAGRWLDDVVYAYLQGEEARKEPPRNMCEAMCGFYRDCRAFDTDVEGVIRDPEALSAVDLYREGAELERQGRRLKDEAKQHLLGVTGSTGEYLIRWTHVNESTVPSFTKKAHDKLEVRAIPKGRR